MTEEVDKKNCNRCGLLLPLDMFNYVSRAKGTQRGQCKDCMREIKRMQREPGWMPSCIRCDVTLTRTRVGGRRLCDDCRAKEYDRFGDYGGQERHLPALKPCRSCGEPRLRADRPGATNTTLCPTCAGVPQSRRARLKNVFNMTPREYLDLLELQRYRCAICDKAFKNAGLSGDAHVDHQHSEPSILRAILCNMCNLLLAMARDRQEILRAAAAMLDDPPAQRAMPGRVAHPAANQREGYMKPSFPRHR